MISGIDHLVILVEALEAAVAEYEELGFRVTPGGEHADGLTRNALVPFADGTYLELVSFVDPTDTRDNVWGWRPFLEKGGGLIDYCAASDDLAAHTRRLAAAGFEVSGPDEGGRRLPDGTEVDLTREQFGPDEHVQAPRVVVRPPGGPTRCAEQYARLRERV